MKTSFLNFQICNELCLNRREVLINWSSSKTVEKAFSFVLLCVARRFQTTRIHNFLAWYIVAKLHWLTQAFSPALRVVWWINGVFKDELRIREKKIYFTGSVLFFSKITFLNIFCCEITSKTHKMKKKIKRVVILDIQVIIMCKALKNETTAPDHYVVSQNWKWRGLHWRILNTIFRVFWSNFLTLF